VWLKIVRSLGRLNDPQCLAAWIFRIARLSVADQLRRQYRTPPAEGWVDYPEDDVAVDVVATTELVRLGLRHLHPTDREAVVLHYIEQLSVAEVADVCGVPAGTIKSRLHRARCVLRQKLA
jgi:RNA polymerase sigma-70 factor (ECF subfamily)